MIASVAGKNGVLTPDQIIAALHDGVAGEYNSQRVLILIPDFTRTIPLPFLFRQLVPLLRGAKQLDFMVALGTHPPLPPAKLRQLVGISKTERETTYRHIGLFNHAWNNPDALMQIGILQREQIKSIAGNLWHPSLGGDVPININRRIFDYDHILILGPTFPHEVAGFSGGAKYLFPGISGAEMINVSHWLGALHGVVDTIGIADTPTRAMIHAAAKMVAVPVTLIGLVVTSKTELAGIFIGGLIEAWQAAAELSANRHILWKEKQFNRILSCAPPMYDELWTAGKAMYKLEPILAPGGELIIYAPHLEQVSATHGAYIYEVGYHVLPYFLEQWERFKGYPLSVLAHSSHVRGGGQYENGRELPNAKVTLSTRLSPAECRQLALDYHDPNKINPDEWANREEEGILLAEKAGEMLYRVKP